MGKLIIFFMMAIVSVPSFSTPDYSKKQRLPEALEVCRCQNDGEDESSDADDDSETQRYEIVEEDERATDRSFLPYLNLNQLS